MTKLIPTSSIPREIISCEIRNNGGNGINASSTDKILNNVIDAGTNFSIYIFANFGIFSIHMEQLIIQGNRIISGNVLLRGYMSATGGAGQVANNTIENNIFEASTQLRVVRQGVDGFGPVCVNNVINGNIFASGGVSLENPHTVIEGPVMMTGNKGTKSVTGTWTVKEAGNSWN